MLGVINNHVLWFAIGVLSTVLLYIILKTVRVFWASYSIVKETDKGLTESGISEPLDQQSLDYIKDCKARLLVQTKINPDWVAPLLSEIPKLVQDIARTYYPNSKNPISAPDLSEFSYAMKLVSSDIADFLQSKPGRILNVSASTAHRTYRVARHLAGDKRLKLINKWYKRLRPIVQAVRYKSPIMWIVLIGRNVAVRTLHRTVVNTIGMRAIQLYSGRLTMQLEKDVHKVKESRGKAMDHKELREIADTILRLVEKLPAPVRESIKNQWQLIKEIVMDSRQPKIMVIGRRGAGKSSLINAIFGKKVAPIGSVMSETGKPIWYKYKEDIGTISILDTRGLGDRSKPESSNFENSLDEIKAVIEEECPDVVLFLCKAKEVDAHISNDIHNITKIREYIFKKHDYKIPIIVAVTQIDELDPKRVEPPYQNETKRKNIDMAVSTIRKIFEEETISLLKTVPISAYAEYDDNGKITYENHWNIDRLKEFLIEILPEEAQLEFARIARIKAIQKKTARKIVAATATVCAGIAATPIPIADIGPITAFQVTMIISIGYIGGRKMTKKTAAEFMTAFGANIGAAFALREATRAIIKTFFPGAGNAISASIAFAGTWGIGETAIAYFIDKLSIEEAKRRGKDGKEKHGKDD